MGGGVWYGSGGGAWRPGGCFRGWSGSPARGSNARTRRNPERRDMAQDLPGYLDLIKRTRPDDLLVVSKEMDPAFEITALVVKLERDARRRPVVICERVRGASFPVLTNLHARRPRRAIPTR